MPELGDRGRDTSAKDIVSSIISAANKKVKIRKKDKSKTYDSIDMGIESEPSSYNERNIDAEIELRQLRQQMSESTVVKESGATTTSISTASSLQQMSTLTVQESSKTGSSSMTNLSQKDGVYAAKVVHVKQKESLESSHTSSTTGETVKAMSKQGRSARSAMDLKRYPAYPNPEAGSLNVSTDNTKSTFIRKVSEESLLDRKGADQHDEVNHQQSASLTFQTKQHLRRLDIETKVLRQKEQERATEQQKLAISKQRIEMELKRTQEELEHDELDEMFSKSKDQSESSSKYTNLMSTSAIETTSITSDYSTNSSANVTFDGKISSPGLMSMSTPSSTTAKSYTSDYSSTDSPASQIHKTKVGHSQSTTPKSGSIHCATVRMLDTAGGGKYFVTGTASSPSYGKHAADDIALYAPSRGTPHFDTRKVAYKGTLQKKRQKGPVPGQHHVYDSQGAGPWLGRDMERISRKGSLDSLLDFHNTSYVDSDSSEDLLEEIASADQRFKLLLSPKSSYDSNSKSSSKNYDQKIMNTSAGFEQQFRDPSLHRLRQQRSEPKIGIASRFERSDKGDLNGSGVRENRLASSTVGRLAKAPKVESNLTKQQTIESKEYAQAIRKSTEKLFLKESPSSPVKSINMPNIILLQQKSKSASPATRKRENKRNKPRRHTVGGTDDLEHFKALMSLRQNQGDSHKLSAWERLRPNVRDTESSDSPDIKAWLQQKRIKHSGSSPALFEQALSVASSESPGVYSRSHTGMQPGAGTREYRGMFRPNSPGSMSTSSSATSQSGSNRGKLTFESAI